jgi:hypothetical protein
MRDGESTLNRKARREPTAKSERKLLPKNRRGVEGQEAKRPSSQPGEGTARIKNPFPGRAHRAAMAVTSINLRPLDGERQGLDIAP